MATSFSRIRRLLLPSHPLQLKSLLLGTLSRRFIHRTPTPLPFLLPRGPGLPHRASHVRNLSHGTVKLVISGGKPRFETEETEPPKKEKWTTKKRLKLRRMREKTKRKAANSTDPRRLTVKGKKKKHRFATVDERIKYKLEKAKIKEALLIERLKKYEVPKLQGPVVRPHELTGEQKFYLKKMGQKASNYVPVGRRGIFGGLILNMHMHWKKHETVKVYCKPCKPGQIHEYAEEIARLSGGYPIQIIGDDTMIFYRGKNYVQPEVMSPIDTLSKKRALEKSKYEQSLESVRHLIMVAEKELELYYRHVALYGNNPNCNSLNPVSGDLVKNSGNTGQGLSRVSDAHALTSDSASCSSDTESSCADQELSDTENELEGDHSLTESEWDDDCLSSEDTDYDTESKSSDQELLERENEFK